MDIYNRKCLYIEVYHTIFDRLQSIYDTFTDYYGESNIDYTPIPSLYEMYKRVKEVFTNPILDNYDVASFTYYISCKILDCYQTYNKIFVKWNTVKVTNEYDESITIKDLYAKIVIKNYDGVITSDGVMLTRRTYTQEQWNSGYSHSHLPHFNSRTWKGDFGYPCLGSGPLIGTLSTLRREFNLNLWGLFVYELDKYVRVESVEGVPYIRLNQVTGGRNIIDLDTIFPSNITWNDVYTGGLLHDIMSKFIKYFIGKKDFKVSYRNGRWILGESYLDFSIKISNYFINFVNDYIKRTKHNWVLNALINDHIVIYYNIKDGKLYDTEEKSLELPSDAVESDDYYTLDSNPQLEFKGEIVPLRVLKEKSSQDNKVLLLNTLYIMGIIRSITILINTKYGNSSETRNSEEADSEEIIYII